MTRLAAVHELMIADARENAGLHEYDGVVQDLSAAAVTSGLSGLATGPARTHDERHLAAFENGLRWYLGEFEAHRRDPALHVAGLDLACYDRTYAPEGERAQARRRHLELWPAAADVAVRTLDKVPAAVARAVLPAAAGLAVPLTHGPPPAPEHVVTAALAAHGRLIGHLKGLAEDGDPDCAVGRAHLASALGAFEGLTIDVTRLAVEADVERERLRTLLAQACALIDPHRPTREVVATLLAQRPTADAVLALARELTAETIAFTREHDLAPWTDGECRVGPAPPSRAWAMAMMAWSAPGEPDAPSWYHVTPPDPAWPADEIAEWLSVFSPTTLPAITVHEVAPGHFAHARSLRRVDSPVRRQLIGMTFAEGWAHYAEELALEQGFRSGDPRFAVGVCLEALVRCTRLVCSIGLHTGVLDVAAAATRFEQDAYLSPAAARSEANRGTFDVGYGRYTLGKLRIMELRREARVRWGADFSLPRLHGALLDLGSPPLALIDAVL
jgi:hypothetical protein